MIEIKCPFCVIFYNTKTKTFSLNSESNKIPIGKTELMMPLTFGGREDYIGKIHACYAKRMGWA